MRKQFWAIVFVFAALALARADAAFLMEEPYGTFGSFNPTGHAAVYLTRICAASPTHLRLCQPGEAGVVISRYNRIAGYDWLAIPLLPYLYAVDSAQEVPQSADAQQVAALRDRYRREHLLELAPDDANGDAPKGNWTQLIGSAYDRKIYGFQVETTPEQDAAFIALMNQRANRTHFDLFYSNCADFAASVLNFYAPHAIHRQYLTDLGITTPKRVAKSFTRYAHQHPTLELSSFQVLQVPGSIKRSKRVDGVAETLLKSKKYVVPLAILSPELAGGIAVVYFTNGRFHPQRNSEVLDIARVTQPQPERGAPPALDSAPAAQPAPLTDFPPTELNLQRR